jgi:hypothetical protein
MTPPANGEGGRGFALKGQVDVRFVLGRFGMLF